MDFTGLCQKMVILFFCMAAGFVAAKAKVMDVQSNKKLSSLVVNVSNPMQIVASALTGEHLLSNRQTLDETEQELQSLQEENETAQTALAQNAELLQEQAGQLEQLQAQADFMDRNVVFVEDDGSGLYHRYGCSRFAAKDFTVYSRKQAAAAGYSACPDCG